MAVQIALLRGINVGGKNKIKMDELRKALGKIGLERVQTYIQSGNIFFESDDEENSLRERVKRTIEHEFGLQIPVVMRTSEELKQIVANLPFSEKKIAEVEASSEGECLYVSMLKDVPLPEKIEKLNTYDFVGDEFHISGRDIYLLLKPSIRNSKLVLQIEKLGVTTTTRNWKTINKLVEIAEQIEGGAI